MKNVEMTHKICLITYESSEIIAGWLNLSYFHRSTCNLLETHNMALLNLIHLMARHAKWINYKF